MLSITQRELVKATVPALRVHGETISRVFYHNMFEAHPELYNLFNPANQRDGGQARSLAAAVLAYAEHIDNPAVLGRMLERLNGKHASLDVKPEQYAIVGKFLLGAITEVLGSAATPAILETWGAAYSQLADIMIQGEAALYDAGAAQVGGWREFKPFRIERKVLESDFMTSFYLVPADGAELPPFRPGQYLSVKIHPAGFGYDQIRQYSISCDSNGRFYRISVQREEAGLISNYLHDALREGDTIAVHMPFGDFTLAPGNSPILLLSGGSGITAVLSMLEHLASADGGKREVTFIHGARGRTRHAFREHVQALGRQRPGIRIVVLYEAAEADDREGYHFDAVGRLDAEMLREHLLERKADVYYCGPLGFMAAVEAALDELEVPLTKRHSEAFGPDPSFAAFSDTPVPQVSA